ncbi:bifunctional metallophosphatase/5'-nucleotidase [Blastococcus capsensis]|uniref:bifunctional metallophosphatase/5'-nucleotidase n=1 Tax=Blastococcus capsensis TaxID=1564163 RepID=UPI0025404A42|nr:bifunctional UDP-sugar hydrolase/5'-nucleotidase [Blastococcus capsensis]MDK3258308.1 bifunctional UDP-sugar hydrolase/5'-nucleotidase [Blastococcus capsensis]
MRRTRLTLTAAVVAATSAALVAGPTTAAATHQAEPNVPVQLIAMNDFHGRISQTTGGDALQVTAAGPDGAYGTPDDVEDTVGGSAHVAATVQRLTAEFQAAHGAEAASVFVGAGDLISASSFESSVFKDEPTIEVLNAMGLDVTSVGNHEFDRGTEELRRVSAATDGTYTDDVVACPETLGGEAFRAGVDGCFGADEHAFHGADFPFLAANVLDRETGRPMLPPYQIVDVGGGERMALIGVVTESTPTIVSPGGVADVEFIDEADAINRVVPELLKQGVKAIGVLVHEGGFQQGPSAANPNGCDDLGGPLLDINQRTHPQVDLIVSAHTHSAYNCLLPVPDSRDRLVTSAGYYGRLVSDIRVMIKPSNGDVDRKATYAATNVPVLRTAADARVQSIVDYWNARAAEARNRVVGTAGADIERAASRDQESSLGNLVAQMQLEAVDEAQFGTPVIAFMNPGGLRTDIAAGEVTYGELYAVQPFGNTVNVVTLTGADIEEVLEQQFQADQARQSTLMLGTSEGFAYSFDPSRAFGDRVDACSITLDGVRIDPAASYRVAANSFLIGGGDSFTAFTKGTSPATGPVDVETAVEYFGQNSPVSPPAADHATLSTVRGTC